MSAAGARLALVALVALLALVALATAGARTADEYAQARHAFVQAWAAIEAGQAAAAPSGALADYPLYPYLEAAQLERKFSAPAGGAAALPADAEARSFLERHGAEPVGRIVRAAWLDSLALRRRWRDFLEVYARAASTGPTLRCQAAEARIALEETEGLAADAVREWLIPESAPEACDPVFDWLRRTGRLDAALTEERARLALAAGETRLARWLAKSLPDERARPLRDWATLIERPQAAVDALIRSPQVAVEREAALDGWSRLATRNPDVARDRYEALVRALGLDAAGASPFAKALALGLSWSRRPALRYFEQITPDDYDDLTHEWHARAALWAGDWAAAARAIDAMPAPLRDGARWRYWLARAFERRGARQDARSLYESVIPTDNWYAVLAAARSGQPFAPHAVALGADPSRVAELDRLPSFVRARELLLAGLRDLAPAEWRDGYETLDAPGQRAAILLAHGWGWYFQAIASAAQQRFFEDYALLYPRPYADEVAAASRASGLPATLVYAVIRQESLYQPYAESTAGAVGLMQLLPSTARQTAAVMGRARPGAATLGDPRVNVLLGAGHLGRLVDRFDGQVLLALAAYNAGTGPVRRWLPDEPVDVDVWVENIPYNETRGYVQRVMWHSVVFEWLADGEPEDADSWLVQVRRPAD